jgi:hypothetical protein
MPSVSLGTVDIVSNIAGNNITFPVTLSLDIATTAAGMELDVLAQLGMSELQSKFNSIAKSFPMPSDNSGYGTKYVASVESANLTSRGDTAILDANINVTVWQIERGVPLGSAVIRRETRCVEVPVVGRVCTDVPVKVEPSPGPDIKLKLLEECISGKISMFLTTPDGKSIEVRPSSVEVTPRSDIGKFFDAIAGIFKVNLSALAQREIAEIVNDGTLRQALPKEILAYDPSIKSVQFHTAANGSLEAHVHFYATLTASQLTDWVRASVGR